MKDFEPPPIKEMVTSLPGLTLPGFGLPGGPLSPPALNVFVHELVVVVNTITG